MLVGADPAEFPALVDMLETMYQANGVGLAAPQVGVSERMVVIDVGDGPLILINPEITKMEGENRDVEGCLSLPGRNEYITRADRVSVIAYDLNGKMINLTGEGLLARAFQHEIDHLNGILFIDYLKFSYLLIRASNLLDRHLSDA